MRTLADMAKAVHSNEIIYTKKIMLFGDPGTGKSHIAGTIAKVPSIKRVYWFDLENGLETLIYAKDSKGNKLLEQGHLEKIIPICITDTVEVPRAAETILKTMTSKKGVHLDDNGIVRPSGLPFNLTTLTEEDSVVIDSGSQLVASCINLAKIEDPSMLSMQRIFGVVNNYLAAIFTSLQAAKCHVIVISHPLEITKTITIAKGKTEELVLAVVPYLGSRNFSRNSGKYFGYKLYTYSENGRCRLAADRTKHNKILISTRKPVTMSTTDPSIEHIFSDYKDEGGETKIRIKR